MWLRGPTVPVQRVMDISRLVAARGELADRVAVRIVYDHRVLDGANVARALARLEEKLNHDIVDELEASRAMTPNDRGAR